MILGLRLIEGINKEEFYLKYNKNINDLYDLEKLTSQGLIVDNGINIYIPLDKLYISNEILVNFIKE